MPQRSRRMPRIWQSLSARLLVLTVFFVMLVEIFVYAPSVARYRLVYLQDKLSNAHLATLALEAAGGQQITPMLQERLLDHARAYLVMRREPGQPKRVIMRQSPPPIDKIYDLRQESFFGLIMDAFEVLVAGGGRTLRVIGPSPEDPKVLMDIVVAEKPLYSELVGYSWRILLLSVLISLVTAALVYGALHFLMVRPLRSLTENMVSFRGDPEDVQRMLSAGRRADEIGVAQREYAEMQRELRTSLRQKERLAALGGAVTRINHDLRNMLAPAQLVSDRLTHIEDPEVKRVAPRLVRAIDRAVELCTQTLAYAGRDLAEPKRTPFSLAALVDEVFAEEELARSDIRLSHTIGPGLEARADRAQIYRVFANLVHNAAKAGASSVAIRAAAGPPVVIDVTDDGPGVPAELRDGLFIAFKTHSRNGGTGLGLAISREIVEAHGGSIRLVDPADGAPGKDAAGAHFQIRLP